MKCSGPECDRDSVARGLCPTHWKQQRRHGRLWPITTNETPIDRFRRYTRTDENGCWVWIGSGSGKFYDRGSGEGGYGQLRWKGQSWMAHRWAYEYWVGPLHPDDTLDHLCRNTRCCNPEHLEIVSRSENIKRKHLYQQLRSEIDRYRAFIEHLGFDPDDALIGEQHADLFASSLRHGIADGSGLPEVGQAAP